MEEEPREYTKEEMCEMFIDHLRCIANYWATVKLDPENDYEKGRSVIQRRLDGMVFSVLTTIDGCAGLPAFNLVPHPHPDDKEYHKEEGENWWSDDKAINDEVMLHETFHQKK